MTQDKGKGSHFTHYHHEMAYDMELGEQVQIEAECDNPDCPFWNQGNVGKLVNGPRPRIVRK